MMRLARDDVGSGAPVLLLHGFPSTRKLWKDVLPALAAAGFRAIAADLAGYGESPDAEDVGMAAQAGFLAELLDELELPQVAVVAHDVGTAAAQLLTVHAPQRVRKLVLMDGVYETEWAMQAVESIAAWDPAQADRLVPVLGRRLKPIRGLLEGADGRRLIHAARCLDPSQTAGVTRRLRATGVPVRLVWGAEDAYLPVDTVARPLAGALGAELRTIPGGHFVPAENPGVVARELISWLA